jgi:hypothetical protein
MNTELKYRTFDQLLNEVAADFTMYSLEGYLEPSQLIKVTQRVTYDLGLRIHGTKEITLDVEKCKAKLPDDFYVVNYAYLTGQYKVTYPMFAGRETENVIVGTGKTPECPKCSMCMSECGCEYTFAQECQNGESIFVQVVEKRKTETRVYDTLDRIQIAANTGRKDALDNKNDGYSAYIKNGYIYTNIDNGKIYISYQGALEDEDGNLLVLDHPLINEYYEYALKQRILENLLINGENVSAQIQIIEQRLRAARNNALTVINTPNFSEMYQLWKTNRKAMYSKYYDMFKTYYTY